MVFPELGIGDQPEKRGGGERGRGLNQAVLGDSKGKPGKRGRFERPGHRDPFLVEKDRNSRRDKREADRREKSCGEAAILFVLEDRSAAAADESGEVWVRGPNVMLGYWRNPEATAAVLENGWLKTGDMGYLDRDGFLYLHGRRSDMIKTGAHRVHPLDVENVIQELAEVGEVAVAGVDDEILGQAIKAFVVAAPGVTPELDALRGFCREVLADYKAPDRLQLVERLPVTSVGKVDKRALLALW